jgi:tetratricopeptide (TPR) repeat protein
MLDNINDTHQRLQNQWWVTAKVTTIDGQPIQGATVEVEPLGSIGEFRTFSTNLQGTFRTDYWLRVDVFKEFGVTLIVTKKGYLKANETVYLTDPNNTWIIPVTLREPGEDPKLLSQASLLSSLTPRLKKLGASDGLSAAAEKDYAHGVEEFLERKRPDLALLPLTKVLRHDPSCVQCQTMLALADLASSDWDGAYRNLGLAGQKMQADPKLGRAEPLLALGVMECWQHKARDAAGYFVEALKYAPHDPLVLQELGRSQVLIENWESAQQYLSQALAAGAGPPARLLRAEALLGGDQVQAASGDLTRYLEGRDVKTMPFAVRQLWVQIENRKQAEADYQKAQPKGEAVLDHYLHHPPSELKGLEPASDQKPLESILSEVGKTVAAYFLNFPNTTSLEAIHQQKLSRKQRVSNTLDRKFRYLCFTPPKAWGPGFDEYRVGLSAADAAPQALDEGYMLTSGFASASLLFHPVYQSQAVFRYLGRQTVNGRHTYVIAFAQQPSKARIYGRFKFRDLAMATYSQGLAWIDPDTYEITRLRTDLLMPLREVRLERETTEIAYGPVSFKTIDKEFLLPQQVTVTVDWNGRHLQNEHRYSEFKLFNVEATDKLGKPKAPSDTPASNGAPSAAPRP